MYAVASFCSFQGGNYMKKRILSLILASVMMLSCFALYGCGDDTESDSDQVGRVPTTLTLWLPAAEGTEVDSEAVVNVENAINEYTQNKFSTAIKLKVFPAEDYDSLVLSKIYEIKQAEDAAAAAEAAARKAKPFLFIDFRLLSVLSVIVAQKDIII